MGRRLAARMSAAAGADAASLPRYRRGFTEEHLFLLLAIIIGIIGGVAVVGFRLAIVPRSNLLEPAKAPIKVQGVATVADALAAVLGEGDRA